MKFFCLMAACAVLMSGAAFAQSDDGTVAASQPVQQKSLRDMSAEERAQFWQNLPAEEKARIMARRQEAQAAQSKKQQWLTPHNNDNRSAVIAPHAQVTEGNAQARSMASGKAQWDAMTPEQKKAFVKEHEAEIRAAVSARQMGQ